VNLGTAITLIIIGICLIPLVRRIVKGNVGGCHDCSSAGSCHAGCCDAAEHMVEDMEKDLDSNKNGTLSS